MTMTAANNGQDILIYAELLANIRQISVKVTLPSSANDSTRAEIIDKGAKLSVSHDGAVKELCLPATTPPGKILPINKSNSQELSWRLPLLSVNMLGSRFVAEHQALPWTASDIKPGSGIVCRACNVQLVSEGAIETWKDLPSENWAEMMEFWHCHKPVDHSHVDGDEHTSARGYGANNTISAKPGVGFIDISSFMLSESDCKDILYSSGPGTKEETSKHAIKDTSVKFLALSCKGCSVDIGTFKVLSSSVILFKWRVLCKSVAPVHKAPSSTDCIAATVVSTISRTGSSKSILMPNELHTSGHKEALECTPIHLWVLNGNISYTSSLTEGKRTGLKVLYQDIAVDEATKLLESVTGEAQDIAFPQDAIGETRRILNRTTSLLPASERSFQNWSVGLLERWDPGEEIVKITF